jgi:hypothetical protein
MLSAGHFPGPKCSIRTYYYPFVCTMGPISYLLHLLQTNFCPATSIQNNSGKFIRLGGTPVAG